MIDYIKKNHLGMLIIVFLVVSALFGGKNVEKIVENNIEKNLGSINRSITTISNPFTFQQGITLNANGNNTGSALIVNGTSTYNNLSKVISSGSFTDASTTQFDLPNPFVATSTVIFTSLNITGVSTSTINISVATSTTGYAPTTKYATTTSLINMAPIIASSTPYIVAGTTVGSGSGFSPASATSTSGFASQTRIVVGPNEHLVGWVEDYGGLGSTAGVTNTNNQFAGTYRIEWVR